MRKTLTHKIDLSLRSEADRKNDPGAPELEEVTVRWPSGGTEALGALQADRVYVVLEGEGVIDSQPPSPE